jgi:hypothetical protein
MRGTPAFLQHPDSGKGVAVVLWLVALFVLLIIKASAFGPQPGDEGIYMMGGDLLLDGYLPYRDFFLAHPPLRTFVSAALLWLTASPMAIKMFSFAMLAGASAFLGLGVALRFGGLAGLLASLLLLGSDTGLFYGPYFMGVETSVFLLCAGYFLIERGRPLGAGLLHGLAIHAGLYAGLPVLFVVLRLILLRERPLRYVLGLLPLGLAYVALVPLVGPQFLDQTLAYHLAKSSAMEGFRSSFEVLFWFLQWDYAPVLLCFCTLPAVIAALLAARRFRNGHDFRAPQGDVTSRLLAKIRRRGTGALAGVLALQGLGILGVISLFPSIHGYYFMLALPMLSAGAASGVSLLRDMVRSVAGRNAELALLATLGLAIGLAQFAILDRHVSLMRKVAGVQTETIIAMQVAHDLLPPGTCIFGDSSIVPLAALYHDLPVTANALDTNPKRIFSGMLPAAQLLALLEKTPPGLVLLIDEHGIAQSPEVRQFVRTHYRKAGKIMASGSGYVYRFFLRRGQNPFGPP